MNNARRTTQDKGTMQYERKAAMRAMEMKPDAQTRPEWFGGRSRRRSRKAQTQPVAQP
jgi:hypothetical protein